jgi:hypothetical protein
MRRPTDPVQTSQPFRPPIGGFNTSGGDRPPPRNMQVSNIQAQHNNHQNVS